MNANKKGIPILLTLGVLILIAIAGCKKFLNRQPLGQAINSDVQQGGVQAEAFGLYSNLKLWGVTQLPYLMLQVARSDDAIKGSTPSDGADVGVIVDNFQYTKAHWMLDSYWDDHYTFVANCNNVLHDVDSLKLTDIASFQNKGEAAFFRAYAYFDLVRTYGEVPLITSKVYNVSQNNLPKSPMAKIFMQIEADLDTAEQLLPQTWPTQFTGRVTSGAAHLLDTKVNLFQQNWTAALGHAKTIISSAQYQLVSTYSAQFQQSGENGPESVLEVMNYDDAANNADNANNSNAWTQYEGVRGSGVWNLGWGWCAPTAALNSSFASGDKRQAATILYSGQSDGYGNIVPPYPAVSVQPYWNMKAYSDPGKRASTGDQTSQWLHMVLYRYADVLLMAAEADNESTGASDSVTITGWVNMIRERAGLADTIYGSQAAMRTVIKMERRSELGMEYDRFFDLVRWETNQGTPGATSSASPAPDGIDAISVLGPLGYTQRNAFYPIPQEAIDKSGGTLIQNPDYP